MDSALVLGAGGITGIAWHLGVLIGLRSEGVDLTTADLLVGTSAGSVTGTLIATGADLAEARHIEAGLGATDPPFRPDWERGTQAYALLHDEARDPASIRAGVGELAVAAEVVDEESYVAALARRLPVHDWPARPLLITAVNTAGGDPVVWDRTSGVPLDRAVAASCAVPCVFPPVTVNGGRYMDGGVRSGTNADLAAGASRVIVMAPLAPVRIHGAPAGEIEGLRQRSKVALIAPDEETLAVLGPNPMDSTRWEPVIEAGIAQGRRLAPEAATVWHS
ncbi:patatin-like phospholipase family protein [Paractinoplanes lichenicola]|uniref:Patatin-like phospholipase family protein n=1 Tax=Paractinoplanes lichenicola TaxID=2802976 RepID=A0ABS1VUF0_9ACTN|nr:patatin-like phospholipase family protein [Actinoplanes lichenicola]MBL7258112.1 patatin-like phospholipase family protein [Actinoplanes lichenicola]